MSTAVTAAELSTARAVARRVCRDSGLEHPQDHETCDDVLLILSELVANACRHGEPPVRYDVVRDGEDLLISVEDADPMPPAGSAGEVDEGSESGRGLLIVTSLARRWGWHPVPGGKVVWARVQGRPTADPG